MSPARPQPKEQQGQQQEPHQPQNPLAPALGQLGQMNPEALNAAGLNRPDPAGVSLDVRLTTGSVCHAVNSRPILAGLLFIAPFAVSAMVGAGQSARVALDYKPDPSIESCPDEQTVRQSLAAKLGYDPISEPSDQVVALRVRRQGAGIQGSLELAGPKTGRRDIDSPNNDCREVVDALVMAAAIAIDPAVLVRPPTSGSVSSSQPAPSPPPPTSASAQPPTVAIGPTARPTAKAPDNQSYSVLLGGQLLLGELPSMAPGVEAGGRVKIDRMSVALTFLGTPAVNTDHTSAGGGNAAFYGANLMPCGHAGTWSGCLLGTFGLLRAEGDDVDVPRRAVRRQGSAGAVIGYDWQFIDPASLGVTAGVLFPFTRTTIRIDGQDIWTTPAVAGRLGGRFALSF